MPDTTHPCCPHCREDQIHDVETNQHEISCQVCDREALLPELTAARAALGAADERREHLTLLDHNTPLTDADLHEARTLEEWRAVRDAEPRSESDQLDEHAAALSQAGDAVVEALSAYRDLIQAGPILPATGITYTSPAASSGEYRYAIDDGLTYARYRNDGPFASAMDSEFPQAEATMLSLSTNWEDRIRAAAMRNSMITPVTLPDGFPCIYEPASSPHNKGRLRPRDHAWVKSADKAMLEELLPLYRELWAAYESGWPQATRRRFEIGALNGLSPYGVYRPGTTAAEVIGETMLTHTGMYATAPEHLKAMHPQHDQWTRPRA